MNVLTIARPDLCTKLEIWTPRYSDKATGKAKQWVALLAQYKVDQASPVIIVVFTKAKHLLGQRFCIRKTDAQSHPLDSNGKIPCYRVAMDAFSSWQSGAEVRDIALGLFDD